MYSFTEFESNIHHGGNDRRSPLLWRDIANPLIPNFKPFENDQEVHIPKKCNHEDELRDELEIKVQFLPKEARVEGLHHDSHGHVDDGDDD